MRRLRGVWRFFRRVPAGLWAALGSALAIFALYLRGRRLEAELAQTKIKHEVALAKLRAAKDAGKAAAHVEQAANHERRIRELETARKILNHANEEEAKRLAALPLDEIHEEYLRRAEETRKKLLNDGSKP